ncbi:helicase loader DnaI [Lentilactobacillus kosonis]|uniref:Helicase loader DnaI n=2 Tax=Lentilactobacillus kosonis TaxID=2810561 RepID=A0A401FPC9_9LACO|nr:helicase loader DnaI [Lentilactobacillus kosonis]
MRASFNSKEEARKYDDLVTNQIKQADVVVIDDLGSEIGDDYVNNSASRYDIDIVTSIYDARASKATITTTNQSGSILRQIYGNRLLSRMIQHSTGNNFMFDGMTDYRTVEMHG